MTNHKPIRCFDGKAEPHEPFWKFRNATDDAPAELELYGVLSEYSWFEDDITPKMFRDDLYAYGKGGPVLLKIHSPGGDIFAASVMRAIMTEYPGPITARVDGLAASAAVIVTMAAKTTQIMDTAYMMIHDPVVIILLAQLDIETLGKMRDDLKAIKDGIVATYAARTGLSEEKLSRMMAEETWMSARQAVEYGFANAVIDGGQKTNVNNTAFVNCLKNYARVPSDLIQLIPSVNPPLVMESSAPRNAELERQAQSLRERVKQILQKENFDA